jgi:tetratricopeptide (TPR) repeat protein
VKTMLNRETEFLKEAEDFENQSKRAIREGNYGLAIQALMKAKDNYTKIGLTGQVSIIIKEIVRLKNLARDGDISLTLSKEKKKVLEERSQFKISFDKIKESKSEDTSISEANGYQILENARALAVEDKYEEAMKCYNEAYSLFKHLDYDYECKQILLQINDIRDYQRWAQLRKSKGIQLNVRDIVALASADKRRQKIQKGLGVKKAPIEIAGTRPKKPSESTKTSHKLFEQMKTSDQRDDQLKKQTYLNVMEQQEQRKSKMQEKEEKIQLLREKKRQEDELISKGQKILEMGNQKLKQKDYDEAKDFYNQAIELFTKIGWYDQITILRKELHNIDLYKKEEELKLKKSSYGKVKEEQDFQKRVSDVLNEKQKLQAKQQERQRALPPEIKSKLEKVGLIRAKADKEESMSNFSRVLARYEYILSLYNSIPKDVIDLSEQILRVEQKILDLKAKL